MVFLTRCDDGYIVKLPVIQMDPRLQAVTKSLATTTLEAFQKMLQTTTSEKAGHM